MPETMTMQSAPTCTCGKLLTFDSGSWRCLSCNPVDPNTPICATQKCKRPLTKLGPPQNCWRCLVCNPIAKTKKVETKKRKYIDVTITDEMVREIIKEERMALAEMTTPFDEDKIREIVIDEMANWHIQKPPVTAAEVVEITEGLVQHDGDGNVSSSILSITPVPKPKPETWLQKAKRLGVQTHLKTGGMRKKVDIMADMERLGEPQEREADAPIPEELRTEEQG